MNKYKVCYYDFSNPDNIERPFPGCDTVEADNALQAYEKIMASGNHELRVGSYYIPSDEWAGWIFINGEEKDRSVEIKRIG